MCLLCTCQYCSVCSSPISTSEEQSTIGLYYVDFVYLIEGGLEFNNLLGFVWLRTCTCKLNFKPLIMCFQCSYKYLKLQVKLQVLATYVGMVVE